jgi:uncharacterized membrane protein YkvA (DUF1232 family)
MSIKNDDEITLDTKRRSIKMTEKLGAEATEKDIEKVEDKLPQMKRGPVAKIWDKVTDIWNGFKDPSTPVSMKVLLIGSLLYLILPLDVVPDTLPFVGLIDDVSVLTLMWNKLTRIAKVTSAISGGGEQKMNIIDKVQLHMKNAYEKAYKVAQDKLDEVIRAKARKTIYNSFVTLGIFIVSYLFIINDTDTSILIGAIGLVYLAIRTSVNIIRNIPNVYRFLKYYRQTRDIDKSISLYLKNRYSFIEPLEGLKNKLKILDDVPDLEIIIRMQRTALRKTIITVSLTVALVIIMFFVLRRYLIYQTPYTTISLLLLPFKNLIASIS